MNEKLERAAEFLGSSIFWYGRVAYLYHGNHTDKEYEREFNPHKKEGHQWLIDILDKFTLKQIEQYVTLLHTNTDTENPFSMFKDLLTAPSNISFKIIMQVITKENCK